MSRLLPRGVVLYGPPAAGKDAVTQALIELDPIARPHQSPRLHCQWHLLSFLHGLQL
ncbi:hypothetical protein GCM10010278_84120 [Streptomyces melanogenes]|nr:hypothetical protein GCM10010278_84120 [Streptomyces melanogenes]